MKENKRNHDTATGINSITSNVFVNNNGTRNINKNIRTFFRILLSNIKMKEFNVKYFAERPEV